MCKVLSTIVSHFMFTCVHLALVSTQCAHAHVCVCVRIYLKRIQLYAMISYIRSYQKPYLRLQNLEQAIICMRPPALSQIQFHINTCRSLRKWLENEFNEGHSSGCVTNVRCWNSVALVPEHARIEFSERFLSTNQQPPQQQCNMRRMSTV